MVQFNLFNDESEAAELQAPVPPPAPVVVPPEQMDAKWSLDVLRAVMSDRRGILKALELDPASKEAVLKALWHVGVCKREAYGRARQGMTQSLGSWLLDTPLADAVARLHQQMIVISAVPMAPQRPA